MVELIVGEYTLKDNDIVVREFSPDILYRTEFNKGFRYALFVEDVSLSRDQIVTICKEAKTDISIISSDKKVFSNIRESADVKKKIEFQDDGNPFKQTEFILKHTNRSEVADFLATNKVSMFMPVKIMVSNFLQLSQDNREVASMLNENMFHCRNDILWHIAAHRIKPEPFIGFLKWNFKKKDENNS